MSDQATSGWRRASRPTPAVLGLLLAVLIAPVIVGGCAAQTSMTDNSRAPGSAQLTAPTATAAGGGSRTEVAKANALGAYSNYISAETRASQTADYGSPELAKYTAYPLLGQWVAQLFHLHVIGDVQRGSVVSHPVLTSLKLSTRSGTATIRDCLDQSGITIVNAQTGAKVSLPKSKPYVAVATLYLYANGSWMVSKVDATGTESC